MRPCSHLIIWTFNLRRMIKQRLLPYEMEITDTNKQLPQECLFPFTTSQQRVHKGRNKFLRAQQRMEKEIKHAIQPAICTQPKMNQQKRRILFHFFHSQHAFFVRTYIASSSSHQDKKVEKSHTNKKGHQPPTLIPQPANNSPSHFIQCLQIQAISSSPALLPLLDYQSQ